MADVLDNHHERNGAHKNDGPEVEGGKRDIRQADPSRFHHGRKIHHAESPGKQVGHHGAHENGDGAENALAETAAKNDNEQCHESHHQCWPRRFVPVAEEHVVYGSVGQTAPDDENDLGHYNGGNETGDPIGSHHAHDKGAQDKDKAGTHDGRAHPRRPRCGTRHNDGADEAERRPQIAGNLPPRDQQVQCRANARAHDRHRGREPHKHGNQHRGTEHGKKMLEP